MERITALTEPPVVGQSYSVPTVRYEWLGRTRDWPVFPLLHRDREFIKFDYDHYHIDPRFVSKADQAYARGNDTTALRALQRAPLASRWSAPHPPIVWRRRACQLAAVPYALHEAPWLSVMQGHFAGHQCERARTGWVCPHWNIPLGSFPPVDGVITCPMHGLKINADTGQVCA